MSSRPIQCTLHKMLLWRTLLPFPPHLPITCPTPSLTGTPLAQDTCFHTLLHPHPSHQAIWRWTNVQWLVSLTTGPLTHPQPMAYWQHNRDQCWSVSSSEEDSHRHYPLSVHAYTFPLSNIMYYYETQIYCDHIHTESRNFLCDYFKSMWAPHRHAVQPQSNVVPGVSWLWRFYCISLYRDYWCCLSWATT